MIGLLFNWVPNLYPQTAADTTKANVVSYNLKEVEITATNGKKVIDLNQMATNPWTRADQALTSIPFLVISNSGSRNEATLSLRGYDLRSVPVFVDGIPVYIPYDGNFDLARLSLADVSKIDVSAGNASLLYGPNTQGGAINLVTRKPSREAEATLKSGITSGNGYTLSANVGRKTDLYHIMGHIMKIHRDFFSLSHRFDTTGTGIKNFQRDNSYVSDFRAGIRLGLTPNKTDEYIVSYAFQHSTKGNPVYLGADPKIPVRYWQWPQWDKQSIYFLSGTRLSKKLFLKSRLYYDQFKNQLSSYDDNTYTTQKAKYAFTSYYDDDTYGGSIECSWNSNSSNTLRIAIHYKRDNHREHNDEEPIRHASDNNFMVATEYEMNLSGRASLLPSLSFNRRESVKAEDFNSKTGQINAFPKNNNNALNAQILLNYRVRQGWDLRLSTARKTRFPTMKDRYSYRLGKAIPNPDLKPEQSIHYELYNNIIITRNLSLSGSLFQSLRSMTIQMVDNVEPGLSQVQNTGRSKAYGTDLTLVFKPVDNISLSAGYAYLHQKNTSNPEVKFVNAPEHKIFAELDLRTDRNMSWAVNTEYNAQNYSTSYGTTAPAFVVFNTWLSIPLTRYFTLQGGINNVFDTNYSRTEGYPEEGRNFYLSVIVSNVLTIHK